MGLLLLGVALGAVLRLGQVTALEGVPVGNATHAHSHTLYFGWAGLALFTLFFERVGATGRFARAVLGALAVQGLLTFFVFFRFGYEKPGVVLAAATLFPFLTAVVVFFRAAAGRRGADLPFLRAAAVYVLLAYVSALSRVVLKVMHLDDPLLSALAVHLFLGAFGAFFVLGLMGLTVRALGEGKAGGPTLAFVLGLSAPLLALPSVLVVPGVLETALGNLARLAALLLLAPTAAWVLWVFRHSERRADRWLWRSAALASGATCLLLAAVATGALGELVLNRHAVVLSIHLQTLGVVTAPLLLLLELRLPRPSLRALWLHQVAISMLLAGLALAAFAPGRPGLVLAALGGLGVVSAQAWSAARFWTRGAAGSSAASGTLVRPDDRTAGA